MCPVEPRPVALLRENIGARGRRPKAVLPTAGRHPEMLAFGHKPEQRCRDFLRF